MKLECPGCQTRYTVDDSIIPPQGAKIRCRKCGGVITVPPRSTESPVPAPAAQAPAPSSAPPQENGSSTFAATASTPASRFSVTPRPNRPQPGGATPNRAAEQGISFNPMDGMLPAPAAPPAAAPTAAPAFAPAPASAAPSAAPGDLPPEEKARHDKARRLARVLASDIAIYNKEKRERGLAEGNLVAVLGYEIKKSWEIYKERVGADFANATPYFRDALNDLLAEGKKIF
ncbi:MAG TPA: zinc-ribbon domain-containing protein [Candidatus Eisenbacteria bacterium]|nr:zinc-ribbon domain-containing protein [Candidatus Eisenbacteria bacterium]